MDLQYEFQSQWKWQKHTHNHDCVFMSYLNPDVFSTDSCFIAQDGQWSTNEYCERQRSRRDGRLAVFLFTKKIIYNYESDYFC